MANDDVDSKKAQDGLNKVATAANRVSDAFGGILTGVPKSVGGVSEAFKDLHPALGLANKAIKGFEGYVGVIQALSSSGINFGMQIDEMILQAGAARMQIGDLARVAGESSEQLAQMGAGADAGIRGFLARQADFYDQTETLFEQRLKRLGLTVDDINDRFMAYDLIQNVANITERKVGQERNKRATEFAEALDEVAKLTGKQAQELAKNVEATAREGRVFASMQLLPESVRTEFATELQSYAERNGPLLGNFMKDMVTQGFPSPNDPAMLMINSFAPQLAGHFERYNAAMKAGQTDQAQIHLDRAQIEAQSLRTNKNFLEIVRFAGAGVSEFAGAAGEVSTSLNNSSVVSDSAIKRQLLAADKNLKAEDITAQMIDKRRKEIVEQNKKAQQEDRTGPDALYQNYIKSLTKLQQIGESTQQLAVEQSFKLVTRGVAVLADSIAGIDPENLGSSFETGISNILAKLAPDEQSGSVGEGKLNELLSVLHQSSTQYNAGSDTAKEIQKMVEQVNNLIKTYNDEGQTGLTQEQQTLRNQVVSNMQDILSDMSNPNIAPQSSEEIKKMLERIKQLSSFNAGTMGAGKLFKDFGSETLAKLHGLEAVTTPEQMASIVKNSSAGTMESLVEQFNSGSFQKAAQILTPVMDQLARNNVSALNGMLNTVRTQVSTGANNQSVDIDLTKLEDAIMKLPSQFKKPMEEALTSSMKPSIEAVAQNTLKSADYNERTFKNTKGMNGDYMRGA